MAVRPLTNELQKKAESEINEKRDRIKEDLEYIREWVTKEYHLNIRIDDQWLVAFLRGCKFSLQRTKEKLDHFYTMRTLVPEYFDNRDPFAPELQRFLKNGSILPLPITTDSTEPRTFLLRFWNMDPKLDTFYNLVKTYLMIMDIMMLEDDNCTVSGINIWVDHTNLSMGYLTQYTPSFLKKCITCVQSAYPLRIKGIFLTNTTASMETVFNLIKSFLNEKLRSRFKVYSKDNVKQFYKEIPQNFWAKEYGGEVNNLDEIATQWKKKVESYNDWFKEDAKYCTNESLRRGNPKASADVFGVEGTFTNLTID